MLKFGFNQRLASLCFMVISVSVLLVFSFPAKTEVASSRLTVLNMEEMSQIAGGSWCYTVGTVRGTSMSCQPVGTICATSGRCGGYTRVRSSTQLCMYPRSLGYLNCSCVNAGTGPMWEDYNCSCSWFRCRRVHLGSGPPVQSCTGSGSCGVA